MKGQPRGNGRGRSAFAFALGAVAGSIISLLYAPASGQVTRRRLAMKAREAQRKATRKLNEAQKVLACKAEEVRETATDWIAEHVPHNGHDRRRPRRRALHHA